MTLEMWLTLFILAAAITLFITEKLRVDVVALGVVVSLMLTGLLTAEEAIAGFSSSAVLTIAALFIVGGAVMQTGLAAQLGNLMLRVAGKNELRLIIVLMVAVSAMSGVMSDTGVVAVMLPAIVSLAGQLKISPSRLLIPMAYGALFGGKLTLIGTPPNIIVAEALGDAGFEPFGFFGFTGVGVVLLIAGVVYMTLLGRRLLPDNKPVATRQISESPEELMALYRLPDNLFRLRVRSKSSLVGQSIQDAGLGNRYDIGVLEILRPPQRNGNGAANIDPRFVGFASRPAPIHPRPETVLHSGDILIVRGEDDQIRQAVTFYNLGIQPVTQEAGEETLITQEIGIAEVLLPPRSTLVGKTLTDIKFSRVYHLNVLALKRPGVDDTPDLKDTRLQFGDTLLVQGEWKDILALQNRSREFILMGETESVSTVTHRGKAPVALGVLVGMLLLMVFGLTSVTGASMLAGLAMVLTGCLSMDDAYRAIDWKSLVLIAGMLPMATALEKVGLVVVAADAFTGSLGEFGPVVIMAGLFIFTTVFTQVLSNTATTVLVAPIAIATASSLGVRPQAFMMAVAVAASMAFASPVASPVNTLVMGAGRYSFGDYAKVGVPLIVVGLIVSMLVLPLLYPF